MDKFDEMMEKLAKSYEDRADSILEESHRNTEGSASGTAVRNIGTFALLNLIILGMAALTFWLGNQAYKVSINGEITTGTVTDLAESLSDDSCCVYSPIVEYRVDSQTYSFESMNASDPPRYKVGQQVEVIYDRTSPSEAAINSWSELWLGPVILGLATIILGVVLNWYAILKISKGEPIWTSDD